MLSWGSMARTNRVALGVLAFTGIALALVPQTSDMLAGLSDSPAGSVGFHVALWTMAILRA
jgi:hypothetical protein